jgi:hypothetical protein
MNTYYTKSESGEFVPIVITKNEAIKIILDDSIDMVRRNLDSLIRDQLSQRVANELDLLDLRAAVQTAADDLDMGDEVRDAVKDYIDNCSIRVDID